MDEVSVFRPGSVSYLRIPAPDVQKAAAFYRCVFGWKVRGDSESPGFQDASGHVIGHLRPDLTVVGQAGVVPYVYVDDLDDMLTKVLHAGGKGSISPCPEGDLWVAMTEDPAGNAIGVWQRGIRQGEPTS